MEPTGWSVLVEAEAPEGAEPIDTNDGRLDKFSDVLMSAHSGVVAASTHGWSARISVPSVDPVHADWQAAEAGLRLVLGAAEMVSLPEWPLVRLEAVRDDVLEAELDRPTFPDVLGTQEVTKILGVSRQRLHELRQAGRFPQPMTELAAGPIWLRSAVETFLANWDRSPGRPHVRERLEAIGRARINSGTARRRR